LTSIEYKVLLEENKRKSLIEIAQVLNLSENDVSKLIESAHRKLTKAETREQTPIDMLPRPTVFRLQRNIDKPQQGTMKVGSQILEILSKGVYSAPWNSLKELVSNAYDASATKVEIKYSPEEQKLTVKDDGLGMDYNDFDQSFTFITRSLKRKEGEYSKLFNRPLIGKIGIGVVAASELCEKLKIVSAKKGSDTYFEAMIDFGRIRQKESMEKEFYEVSQFTLVNHEKKDIDEHHTTIELLEIKKTFANIMNNVVPAGQSRFEPETTSFDQIVAKLCSGDFANIRKEAGPLWQFLISFTNVIPIEYLDDGPISLPKGATIPKELKNDFFCAMEVINGIKEKLKSYNFKVYFNDIELRKPIRFPNDSSLAKYGRDFYVFSLANQIVVKDPVTQQNAEVNYTGFFYYQKTRIIPEELRGVIIRIRNTAIGGPDQDLWGYPYTGDNLRFPQVYGEVYVEKGLEDAMNIDRSTFKTSHEEYSALREALHVFLKDQVFLKARAMYYDRRDEKSEKIEESRQEARALTVSQELGSSYKLEETRKFTSEPVILDEVAKKIVVNTISDAFQGFKKDDRIILEDVSIALEIAFNKEKDPAKIRNEFWRILKDLTRYRQ
jgi:hypothetical protein